MVWRNKFPFEHLPWGEEGVGSHYLRKFPWIETFFFNRLNWLFPYKPSSGLNSFWGDLFWILYRKCQTVLTFNVKNIWKICMCSCWVHTANYMKNSNVKRQFKYFMIKFSELPQISRLNTKTKHTSKVEQKKPPGSHCFLRLFVGGSWISLWTLFNL